MKSNNPEFLKNSFQIVQNFRQVIFLQKLRILVNKLIDKVQVKLFVTPKNTLNYCLNVVFLFHCFLIFTVFSLRFV